MYMRPRFLVITSVIFNLERSFIHQYDSLEHGEVVSDDFECHHGILVENKQVIEWILWQCRLQNEEFGWYIEFKFTYKRPKCIILILCDCTIVIFAVLDNLDSNHDRTNLITSALYHKITARATQLMPVFHQNALMAFKIIRNKLPMFQRMILM